MRLRIIKRMHGDIDGVPLDRFQIGEIYDVGTALGSYLLALRAAIPIGEEEPVRLVPLERSERRAKAADRGRTPKTQKK